MNRRKLTGNLRDNVESSKQEKKNVPALTHIKGCIYSIIRHGEMGYFKPWHDDCPACNAMRDVKNSDDKEEFDDG